MSARSKLLPLLALLLAVLLNLAGCGSEPKTGPAEVRWDRVVCARCIMAVSDHYFAGQIRGGPPEKRTKVYYFDDLGCAVLWIEEQEWKDDPRTEMWVPDFHTGEWIDARTAYYVRGNITPMDYGLGAQPDSTDGALNYQQAVAEINFREEKYH